MNVHPLFVHFPLALLALYVVAECLRFRSLIKRLDWFYIKTTLLFTGFLGMIAAILTGDFGKNLYPTMRAIIDTHENFAHITLGVFGFISLIYLPQVIEGIWGRHIQTSSKARMWKSVLNADKEFYKPTILMPLALLGFMVLVITGGLGGSIVYGVTSDPFIEFIVQHFVHG